MKTDNFLYSKIIILLLLLSPLSMQAQENSWMLGIGHLSQLDTYLSTEHYRGFEARVLYERVARKDSSALSFTYTPHLFFGKTSPRSKSSTELSAMFEFSFGMHYNLQAARNLLLAFGGQADVFVGGIYNNRNGNNPAQLHTGISVGPAVRASFDFNLWRHGFRLNYVVSAPLVGMQFSPAYGQSYYEIFARGNYDHNICFASPFNAPSLKHRMTLDIKVKRSAIRVGYMGDYRQAKLNEIKYHHITHSFIIGYVY